MRPKVDRQNSPGVSVIVNLKLIYFILMRACVIISLSTGAWERQAILQLPAHP
jgi:hypothetical protein